MVREATRRFPLLLLEISQILLAGAQLGASKDVILPDNWEPDVGADPDLDSLRSGLARRLADYDEYAELFDPYSDTGLSAFRLSDDLAAVAADLIHGLQHYEAGRSLEALWWCSTPTSTTGGHTAARRCGRFTRCWPTPCWTCPRNPPWPDPPVPAALARTGKNRGGSCGGGRYTQAASSRSGRSGSPVALVVQKYGGSSVADADGIKRVAQRIVATRKAGHSVVVVVSAMGDTTDELQDLAAQVSPPAARPRTRHAAHRGRAHLDGAAGHGDRQPGPGSTLVHRVPGPA